MVVCVHFLANALPGFRDLRAPVVAGYLWLVFAWLTIEPDLGHRPANALAGSIYDLGNHVGPIGVGVGVSVAAYFLGSISQAVSGPLRVAWSALLESLWLNLPSRIDGIGLFSSLRPPESEEITQLAERASTAVSASGAERDVIEDQVAIVEAVADRAHSEAYAELTLPATVLVGKEPELFAEVDRLRAEGEFRLAAVPPLFALSLLAAVKSGSAWWLTGLLAAVALLDQGVRRLHSSRQLVADAKTRGLVPSEALRRFRVWAEAVELKPEAPPPPPWRPRVRRTRRILDHDEQQRVLELSNPPMDIPDSERRVLADLSPDAANLLRLFGEDELQYAGTEVGIGLGGGLDGADELGQRALIWSPDGSRWLLTDRGVSVARHLTGPARSDEGG